MLLYALVFLALSISVARADLACLAWDIFVPIIGLVCHFQPKVYDAVSDATIKSVEEAVTRLKDLVKFELVHKSAVVRFNYAKSTDELGFGPPNNYVGNVAKDFGDVTIGFGKEGANQLIQLYDVTHWNEVSFCLMMGAAQVVTGLSTNGRERAQTFSLSNEQDFASRILAAAPDIRELATRCINDKVSHGLAFNVTDPSQNVFSTISDISAFFIPVGAEEKAGVAITGTVDIAIPGSEDTTRILKKVEGEATAQHFTDEMEAKSVANAIQDPAWKDSFCTICPLPSEAIVARGDFRARPMRRRGPLGSKLFGACCSVPIAYRTSPETDYGILDIAHRGDSSDIRSFRDPEYDPSGENVFFEANLSPPPSFAPRDISLPMDVAQAINDLDTLNTAVIRWAPAMTHILDSDDLFAILRKTFTGPANDALYRALHITERDGKTRLTSFSDDWIHSRKSALKPLQDFVAASVKHGIDTVTKLGGCSDEGSRRLLRGNVEFFWTAPGEKALTGTDPRGFHADQGLMQFAAQDTPGLLTENHVARTASRVPLQKNAFYAMKSMWWDIDAFLPVKTFKGPTYHSVFGPEMAMNGRMSMVMHVFDKGGIHI